MRDGLGSFDFLFTPDEKGEKGTRKTQERSIRNGDKGKMARRGGNRIELGKRRAGEEHHCHFSKNTYLCLSLTFDCLKFLVSNQNLFWTEHVKGVCKREPPHLSLLLNPEYRKFVQMADCCSS